MKFAAPTPELPVEDVERAQRHYRDVLGFEIGWLYPTGEIGAVSRDDVAIFFRRRVRPFGPAVNWIFTAEIDAAHEELRQRGATIVGAAGAKALGVAPVHGRRFGRQPLLFPLRRLSSQGLCPLAGFGAPLGSWHLLRSKGVM